MTAKEFTAALADLGIESHRAAAHILGALRHPEGICVMTRRTCVCCGKLYGRRDVKSVKVDWPAKTKDIEARGPRSSTVKVLDGPPPRYEGNGIVIKETRQYLSDNHMTMTRWVWDGLSWTGGHDPFCTLRCALNYARRAYVRLTKGTPL